MIRTTGGATRRVAGVETRRAPGALTKEELTRHLLALVLAAVLVWYTFVIPAHASARNTVAPMPDDPERGDEVRLNDSEFDSGVSTKSDGVSTASVDELDWPEYICLD